jgi:uncharacterized protein YdeI (YjbR/CyaY-like superfamily)
MKEKTTIDIRSQAELRFRLEQNHSVSGGLWLIRYKNGSPFYISTEIVVKELLCFGWIDSVPGKLDDERSLLYISPRKPQSNWSQVNKRYIAELTSEGLMNEAGLKAVNLAKSNGRWSFLDEIEKGILPKEVVIALSKDKQAERHFEAFPQSVKKGILEWIISAAKEETRRSRIEKMTEYARINKRVNFDK